MLDTVKEVLSLKVRHNEDWFDENDEVLIEAVDEHLLRQYSRPHQGGRVSKINESDLQLCKLPRETKDVMAGQDSPHAVARRYEPAGGISQQGSKVNWYHPSCKSAFKEFL